MKISAASGLVFVAVTVLVLASSHTLQGSALHQNTKPPALNLTNDFPNVTSPEENLNLPVLPLMNLTDPILGPLTNLTCPILGHFYNLTSPILGPLINLTGSIGNQLANLTAPILSTVVYLTTSIPGVANLTNILDLVHNLTIIPLEGMLSNLTGPAASLAFTTDVLVTVTLKLPASVTVLPLGRMEATFTLLPVPEGNVTVVPVTFMVPSMTFLGVPVGGSATVTLDIEPGSVLSVVGITENISRFLFGVSWETFPLLTSVLISKILPASGDQTIALYTMPLL